MPDDEDDDSEVLLPQLLLDVLQQLVVDEPDEVEDMLDEVDMDI